MYQAMAMCLFERVGNLDGVLKHLRQRERAGDEAVRERLTVEILIQLIRTEARIS